MANYTFLILFTLFSLCFCDECIQNSPCTCEYSNGKVIDLNPLGKTLINATFNNLTYYFHPCTNLDLTLNTNATQNCAKGTSLCLFNKTNNMITNLGVANELKFSTSSTNTIYSIVFLKSKTIITLGCTDYPDTILHTKDNKDGTPSLILFSHYNCAHFQPHGLSTGSVLVILLLIFTIIYLLGGTLILHFLRGARGKEIIPNIDFWSDLPLLVRDGAVFLQNGCKPPVSPADTYDRI